MNILHSMLKWVFKFCGWRAAVSWIAGEVTTSYIDTTKTQKGNRIRLGRHQPSGEALSMNKPQLFARSKISHLAIRLHCVCI